ncbi:hypothetical protein [Saccharospirillum salsuginis]|uniref:Phage integrase family protein n=1 Tax=Saccharospirillum salsuginis TaxID=418750 RepID=A0A918N9Q0_9GAMM|nr:hypothetical protein [Saccharospirillum salsuginis]GGX51490.1 hypothetical protein GCM10007392_18480 [Saccharospirillum salsuginis]
MSGSKGEYIRLDDGLAIYTQYEGGNWYIYINFSNFDHPTPFKKRQFSLKTKDKKEATRKAWKIYLSTENDIEKGLPVFQNYVKFNQILDLLKEEYIQKNTDTSKKYANLIDSLLKPFFEDKNITELHEKDIFDFYMSDTDKTCGYTRFQNLKTIINSAIDRAIFEKMIKRQDAPKFPKSLNKHRRQQVARNFFYDDELNIIFDNQNLSSFIQSTNRKDAQQRRIMFMHFIRLMVATGCRPGDELCNSKWGDLKLHTQKDAQFYKNEFILHSVDENQFYTLLIKSGKTQTEDDARHVIINNDAIRELQNTAIKTVSADYVVKPLSDLAKSQRNRFIFAYNDNKPNFDKVWQQYRTFLEENCNLNLKNQTLYSFRHTFITQKLKEGKASYLIAKNCGTSEAMIKRYYDKNKTIILAEQMI